MERLPAAGAAAPELVKLRTGLADRRHRCGRAGGAAPSGPSRRSPAASRPSSWRCVRSHASPIACRIAPELVPLRHVASLAGRRHHRARARGAAPGTPSRWPRPSWWRCARSPASPIAGTATAELMVLRQVARRAGRRRRRARAGGAAPGGRRAGRRRRRARARGAAPGDAPADRRPPASPIAGAGLAGLVELQVTLRRDGKGDRRTPTAGMRLVRASPCETSHGPFRTR